MHHYVGFLQISLCMLGHLLLQYFTDLVHKQSDTIAHFEMVQFGQKMVKGHSEV